MLIMNTTELKIAKGALGRDIEDDRACISKGLGGEDTQEATENVAEKQLLWTKIETAIDGDDEEFIQTRIEDCFL